MYVLVRTDLPAPQIVVQAAHAAIEATRSFLDNETEHPHLVVCGIATEAFLLKEVERLDRLGIRGRMFYEDDRNGEPTAFGSQIVYGDTRKAFRKYKLLK